MNIFCIQEIHLPVTECPVTEPGILINCNLKKCLSSQSFVDQDVLGQALEDALEVLQQESSNDFGYEPGKTKQLHLCCLLCILLYFLVVSIFSWRRGIDHFRVSAFGIKSLLNITQRTKLYCPASTQQNTAWVQMITMQNEGINKQTI